MPPLMPPAPGCVLWKGASRLDGQPIVAIATFRSENQKTGPMIQTWILRDDIPPVQASQSGDDRSVCGPCPLRGRSLGHKVEGRACYVNLLQGGPTSVWHSYKAGRYPEASDRLLALYVAGRPVRLGAYGDPCAVPLGAWTRLLAYSCGHTGYTHQWRDPTHEDYKALLMASVESEAERDEAHALGWRTFRIRREQDPARKGETVCPASSESGHKTKCAECLLCDGTAGTNRRDVVIVAHGGMSVRSSLGRLISAP